MATAYDNANSNTDAQKRGALAAIANGGSQGLAAYNNALAQANAGRQAALGAASKRSALIGGPEAAVGNYSAPINAAGAETSGLLNANKNALGAYMNAMSSANSSYFDKVKAATPIEELATLRELAARRSNSNDTQASILGSTNETLAQNQKTNAENAKAKSKELGPLSERTAYIDNALQQEQRSAQELAQKISSGKGGDKERAQLKALQGVIAHNQDVKARFTRQSKKISKKYKDQSVDPFEIAQQTAVANGMNPYEASQVYSPDNFAVASKLVARTPEYQALDQEYLQRALSGKYTKEDFLTAILNDSQNNPVAAKLLQNKYAAFFPAKRK